MVKEMKRMNIDEALENNKASPHFSLFNVGGKTLRK